MYDPAHPFGRKAVQLAVIDPVSCTGCGWCAMFCPMKCIFQREDGIYEVDAARCIGCRGCKVNCFYGAVTILPPQVRKQDAAIDSGQADVDQGQIDAMAGRGGHRLAGV